MKFIQPRKRSAALSKAHPGPASNRKTRAVYDKKALLEQTKAKFAKVDKVTPLELSKLIKAPIWIVRPILDKLLASGLVVKEGSGRFVTYRRK